MRSAVIIHTISLFALLALQPAGAASDVSAACDEARQLYDARNFRGAAVIYEKLLADHGPSAAVYYNLGNTYYRMDEPGRAALAYERALLLNPGHVEAASNLAHLRALHGSAAMDANWSARVLNAVDPNLAVIGATLFAWLSVLSLVLAIWAPARRAGALVAFALFAVAAATLPVLRYTAHGLNFDPARAVVIHKDSAARYSPGLGAREVKALPPGSIVRVLIERGTWSYVSLGGRDRGWIQTASIERPLAQAKS